MRPAPPSVLLLSALVLLASGVVTAAAAPRPGWPVFDPRVMPASARPPGPRIAGEAFEIRLTRDAASRTTGASRAAVRLAALGLSSLDRLAREHDLEFEPEFPGEAAPRSGAETDFRAFFVVHVPPGGDVPALLDRFASLPEVASVSALPVLRLDVIPNDSLWSSSWWHFEPGGRHDIHAPEGWEYTTGDPSVVVGILDSGVIPYHPDLGGTTAGGFGNLWRNAAEASGAPGVDDDGNGYVDDVSGWDFVSLASGVDVAAGEDWRDEDADPNDFVGHGTACAGLVGALTNNGIGVAGTAWNVRLMPLRVAWSYLGAGPGDGEVRMDFVARAIRYATRAGAHVLNCSFATANTDGLDAAITAATQAGVTIVSSSGNYGSPDALARRPDVISVAATTRDDVVAAFSNVNADVDLCAPGVEILSTFRRPPAGSDSVSLRQPGYSGLLQGTSFAAPLVAGAAALLQARQFQAGRPLLAPAGVRLRLWETASDIRLLNPTLVGQIGGGRLNLAAALGTPYPSTATRMAGTVVGAPVVVATRSGRDRVAFVTSNAKLVVLDLLSADTLVHVGLPDVPVSGLAAVTLDFGRTVALFAGTAQGMMLGYDLDGNPLPGWPTPALGVPLLGGPAVGDLGGDPRPEIVCGGDDANIHAWTLDGAPAPGFPRALGFDPIRAPVALAPLDTFPGLDVVAVNEAGLVAVHRGTGPRFPGWTKSVPSPPRAPVVFDTTLLVIGGAELHRFTPRGVLSPGFPVTLAGAALADPALFHASGDPIVRVAVPVGPPFQLEMRNANGMVPPSAYPVTLAGGAIGTPIVAHVALPSDLQIVLLEDTGLAAFDVVTGERHGSLPKPGGAGALPTAWDVRQDGVADIVAGSGPDSTFYVYSATFYVAGSFPRPWAMPRHDPGRTGTYSAAPGVGIDDVRPASVGDLELVASAGDSVTLRWTAGGGDSLQGRVERWLVRAAYDAIGEADFAAAPFQQDRIAMEDPGVVVATVFRGLPLDQQLAFAIKARDAAGNLSAISNVVLAGGAAGPAALAIRNHPSQVPVTFDWRGASGASSRLRVFDLAGRERASIALGSGAGGSFTWYGADDDGRRLEAGLYFVRFTSGRETIEKRLVVLP